MIKAFTISFDFEGKTYLALTTMKTEQPDTVSYCVRIYDNPLYKLVPEGYIRYSKKELNDVCSKQLPQAGKLYRCIDDSICAHLKLAETES